MTNFEDMLRDAMKHGTSLEDVMKDISTAANKIEKDQAAANKYDVFNGAVIDSFDGGEDVKRAIVSSNKMTTHDVAIVIAHFMCQNVPGYSKVLAESDTDPVKLYQNLLESQMGVAKVLTDHRGDSDENKGKALFSHLLDDIFNNLAKKTTEKKTSEKKTATSASLGTYFGTPFFPSTVTRNPDSDAEKLAKFLKDIGAC